MKKIISIVLIFNAFILSVKSQEMEQKEFIDGVLAIVGNKIILNSELEFQYFQMGKMGYGSDELSYCFALEDMLFNSLLMHAAQLDSIEISDREVTGEVENRIQNILQQLRGDESAFRQQIGKSPAEFREEIRPSVRQSIMAQKMRVKITEGVSATPKEVKVFFSKIPADSVPLIGEELRLGQIVIKPKPSFEEKLAVRKRLMEIRNEIVNNGKDFAFMAKIHSKDPGSYANGGEIGFIARDQLVPEFAEVAFNLQPGEISDIVETDFGFHIIQMIERKGNLVNVRHILKTVDVNVMDRKLAKDLADSVYNAILSSTNNFHELAKKYNSDPMTKENNGVFMHPQTRSEYLPLEVFPKDIAQQLMGLEERQISSPQMIQLPDGSIAFRLLIILNKTVAHPASLENDYFRIKQAADEDKKQLVLEKWVAEKIKGTYVKMPSRFRYCSDLKLWYNYASN